MKKIYKFSGKCYKTIRLLKFPINILLGLSLGGCIVNQSWILFGIISFVALLWLIVVGISSDSYENLYKR